MTTNYLFVVYYHRYCFRFVTVLLMVQDCLKEAVNNYVILDAVLHNYALDVVLRNGALNVLAHCVAHQNVMDGHCFVLDAHKYVSGGRYLAIRSVVDGRSLVLDARKCALGGQY